MVALALTTVLIANLGFEFMPALEEGDTLVYMPSTLPGLSAAKTSEFLQQTDFVRARRRPSMPGLLSDIDGTARPLVLYQFQG